MIVSIPKQLKAWRARAGLSQPDAAAHLGITRRTLENWEQGVNAPRGLARSALLEKLKVQTFDREKKP